MRTPLRIAIADDDRSAREILRKAIEVLGHASVIDVDNGRDLIQQCSSEMPDIVITDNIMGDMTGLEAAAEIFRAPVANRLAIGILRSRHRADCRRSSHFGLSRKADCS